MSDVRSASVGEGEDESYFVSMTDLMVGMLFIFIIILMAFALNLKHQETQLETTTDRLTEAHETRTQMLRDVRRSLLEQGVEVTIDEQNGVLRMPERLLFQRGEFRLEAAGQQALQKLADVLALTLPCYATMPPTEQQPACPSSKGGRLEAVFVEGHTDDVPFTARTANGIANNWELSAARAIAVYNALLAYRPGLAILRNDGTPDHEGQSLIGVSGYGQHRPAVENRDEASRAANRRIDLRFLMATPSQEELDRIRHVIGGGQSHDAATDR